MAVSGGTQVPLAIASQEISLDIVKKVGWRNRTPVSGTAAANESYVARADGKPSLMSELTFGMEKLLRPLASHHHSDPPDEPRS